MQILAKWFTCNSTGFIKIWDWTEENAFCLCSIARKWIDVAPCLMLPFFTYAKHVLSSTHSKMHVDVRTHAWVVLLACSGPNTKSICSSFPLFPSPNLSSSPLGVCLPCQAFRSVSVIHWCVKSSLLLDCQWWPMSAIAVGPANSSCEKCAVSTLWVDVAHMPRVAYTSPNRSTSS